MRAIAASLLGVLAAVGTAAASTLGVAPVRIELSPTATMAVVTVRNQEDSPVVVQARPAAWSQRDDRDQLDETHELLVTPPLFMHQCHHMTFCHSSRYMTHCRYITSIPSDFSDLASV